VSDFLDRMVARAMGDATAAVRPVIPPAAEPAGLGIYRDDTAEPIPTDRSAGHDYLGHWHPADSGTPPFGYPAQAFGAPRVVDPAGDLGTSSAVPTAWASGAYPEAARPDAADQPGYDAVPPPRRSAGESAPTPQSPPATPPAPNPTREPATPNPTRESDAPNSRHGSAQSSPAPATWNPAGPAPGLGNPAGPGSSVARPARLAPARHGADPDPMASDAPPRAAANPPSENPTRANPTANPPSENPTANPPTANPTAATPPGRPIPAIGPEAAIRHDPAEPAAGARRPAPIVRLTVGRLEVRASKPAEPPRPAASTPTPSTPAAPPRLRPPVSLDDYLRQRRDRRR